MALLSKFQDHQALVLDGLSLTKPQTKVVAKALRAIRRPDLTEAEAAEAVGETKTQARKRTLERRSVLFGLPGHDPVLHRSARNIEGVTVAPVAEFNTYDILKQRYLVLTREALTALKERVKDKPSALIPPPRPNRPPARRANPWSPFAAPPSTSVRAGARALPGRHPAPDHREGHPPLGAAQRLHLRGQPAGHQDRDQGRRRDPVQRQGPRRPDPEPPRQARRYRLKVGRMRHWKKAIVSLHEEYRIDFY